MSQIPNYLAQNIEPNLNLFSKRNNFDITHPYVKSKKIPSNNIYWNYSLFNSEMNKNQNIHQNYSHYQNNCNNNNYNFFNNNNSSLYEYKKEKKYMSKSHEPELEMMKLQLRCDLIGQKINQIQNQVQVCKETNFKNDKKTLKKNKTYGNFKENINSYNNIEYIQNENENNNYFKIPIPKKKEIELNDGFRKKQIKHKNKMHNISYINKNINNNFLINDSNNKNYKINNNINNNYNFRQSFFYNSVNQNKESLIESTKKKKEDKIIIKKINSKKDALNKTDNDIVNYNNYINDYNFKYNQNKNINYNNKKKIKKAEILRKKISTQRSKSYIKSPNNKKLNIKKGGKNGDENKNFENILNNTAKYGSFDQFFLNDNNYSDNSYIKYITAIKNNFNNINYKNLDKIRQNSFNNNIQMIQINHNYQNNYVIQKGYNINIINRPKTNINQKGINRTNLNNNKNKLRKNYSFNGKRTVNSAKYRDNINKYIKNNNYKSKDKIINKTQINNNFNVNNNSNYYNFNYNQTNKDKKYISKIINMKNNKINNNKINNNNDNKTKAQNEFLKDYIEENSKSDYLLFNHDYSNDDYIHTSEMLNSTNDNKINYEHTKNQRIILKN